MRGFLLIPYKFHLKKLSLYNKNAIFAIPLNID